MTGGASSLPFEANPLISQAAAFARGEKQDFGEDHPQRGPCFATGHLFLCPCKRSCKVSGRRVIDALCPPVLVSCPSWPIESMSLLSPVLYCLPRQNNHYCLCFKSIEYSARDSSKNGELNQCMKYSKGDYEATQHPRVPLFSRLIIEAAKRD